MEEQKKEFEARDAKIADLDEKLAARITARETIEGTITDQEALITEAEKSDSGKTDAEKKTLTDDLETMKGQKGDIDAAITGFEDELLPFLTAVVEATQEASAAAHAAQDQLKQDIAHFNMMIGDG